MNRSDVSLGLNLQSTQPGHSLGIQEIQNNQESRYPVDSDIRSRIFQYAYSLVRDREDAEDLAQEAFVALFREERKGRPIERLHAWMRTVTRHLAYRRFLERRDGERCLSLDSPGLDREGRPIAREIADSRPTPEAQVIDQRMLEMTARVLSELSPRDRECTMMYFRGYDFMEIGSALGVSRWTARRITLKALKRFDARVNPHRRPLR